MSAQLDNDQGMGVWGVVSTITGFIIGVSVFILPGQLVELAGPAVVLSYVIAGSVAFLSCIVAAQIGVVLPTDGGSFVAISKLISPFFGILTIWIFLISAIVANAFMAFGFADYFHNFVPTADRSTVAVSVVLAFGFLNIFARQGVVRVQGFMVLLFLMALVMFLLASQPYIEMDRMIPFVAHGYGSVFLAATSAYFSFAGFVLLLELGGEVKRPGKTIPMGLAISFVIVLSTYIAVSVTIAGSSLDLTSGETPVLSLARQTLPVWMLDAFVMAILAAAATSINSLIMAYSRDIMVVARSGFLPKKVGVISKTTRTPVSAIILLTLLTCLAIILGHRVEDFVVMAVVGLMIQQIFLAICMWRIPKMMQEQYAAAAFRLPVWLIRLVSVVLIIVSVGFIVLLLMAELSIVLLLGGLIFLGVIYFITVYAWKKSKGIDVISQFRDQVDKLVKVTT